MPAAAADLNHVYMDETYFSYDVMLMHTSKDTGMVSEKWRLRVSRVSVTFTPVALNVRRAEA